MRHKINVIYIVYNCALRKNYFDLNKFIFIRSTLMHFYCDFYVIFYSRICLIFLYTYINDFILTKLSNLISDSIYFLVT